MKRLLIFGLLIIVLSSFVSAGKVNYYIKTSNSCTESMSDLITCRNTMVLNTFNYGIDKLEINDIYVYKPNKRYFLAPNLEWIVHRLKQIDGNMCLFKGDNNQINDPWVRCNTINFKVVNIK